MDLELQGSVEIDRPIDEVHAYVADPMNDPVWCHHVQQCEPVDGADSDAVARYRQLQGPSPVGRDLEVEIREVSPPTHVAIRWRGRGATCDVSYELEKVDTGRTRLTQRSQVALEGGRRLVWPVIRLVYPVTIRQQFAELKQVLGNTVR